MGECVGKKERESIRTGETLYLLSSFTKDFVGSNSLNISRKKVVVDRKQEIKIRAEKEEG